MAPLLSEEEQALDPYVLLGIQPASSDKEVQKAYRKLSLKYHPDKNSTPEGAVMFRKITVSLEMLLDNAKRTYIDTRLESDRKKKEKQAALQGRKREMVEALEKREEEAKRAKVDLARKRKEENEEENIKEAGRRMVEEAQKRAAAQAAQTSQAQTSGGSSGMGTASTSRAGAHPPNGSSNANGPMPPIGPMDLTLFLTIPLSLSTTSLESNIRSNYGPISHFILKDPPPEQNGTDGAKKKKVKSRRGIVEFAKGNWGGCWACWKDHQKETSQGGTTLGEGIRAKWASGDTPAWVDWASQHGQESALPNVPNGHASTPTQNLDPQPNSHTPRQEPSQPSMSTPLHPVFDAYPSFGSAPDFRSTSMADLLASHTRSNIDKAEKKRQEDEFESMTLLKMRQMERERLEAQIRAEEGD